MKSHYFKQKKAEEASYSLAFIEKKLVEKKHQKQWEENIT